MGGKNSGGPKKHLTAPDWRDRPAYRRWLKQNVITPIEKPRDKYYDRFVDYSADCGHMTPRLHSTV